MKPHDWHAQHTRQGVVTGIILKSLSVDLWLVFGVLAFWLNFIPNVGALIAVLLPLPLVVFNPTFGAALTPTLTPARMSSSILPLEVPCSREPFITGGGSSLCLPEPVRCGCCGGAGLATMLSAVLLPLLLHVLVGNVLEPIMFGSSLELHPVIVLLSLMMWSALWGVTGLVLAVPLTAIMRIHLAHVDHPLPRLMLRILEGNGSVGRRPRQQRLLAGRFAWRVAAAPSRTSPVANPFNRSTRGGAKQGPDQNLAKWDSHSSEHGGDLEEVKRLADERDFLRPA